MRIFLALLWLSASPAFAKLNVLVTTADLGAVAREVGGDAVLVDVIASADRDPHFLEAKPSYMVKASRADLVFSNGLELEVGWLPPILKGGRNPKVLPGTPGYLEAGSLIEVLEKPLGAVSRAEGDVHPDGNPHFMLDPIRAGTVAMGLAERLAELDQAHAEGFRQRAQALDERLKKKTEDWKARVQASQVGQAFTYHKTLVYFFDRFGLKNAGTLEPKPGIPPTASHLLELIRVAKERQVKLCLVEHYFDLGAANKLAGEVPGLRVRKAVVMTPDLDGTFEALVKDVEGK
jgi:zinc/manganese transport system substrate-binding protein